MRSICSIISLCMESKALEKSTNNIVVSRFFAHTLSRMRRIVKICDVVDRFLVSIFSILASMRLRSRALYILAAIRKVYTSVVLGYSEVTLLREREDAALFPSAYCVFVIYSITESEQYVVEFPGFPYFWWYFIKLWCFSIFNFSFYWVEFFLRKLS